jgi:hypothetical protein
MESALINKFRNDVSARIKGYEKKVKTQVDAALEQEYNMVILGKQPKAEKKVWKKE